MNIRYGYYENIDNSTPLNLPDTDMTRILSRILPNMMFCTEHCLHSWDNNHWILSHFHEHSYSNCLDFQPMDSRHKNKWYLDNHRNHLGIPFRMDNLNKPNKIVLFEGQTLNELSNFSTKTNHCYISWAGGHILVNNPYQLTPNNIEGTQNNHFHTDSDKSPASLHPWIIFSRPWSLNSKITHGQLSDMTSART